MKSFGCYIDEPPIVEQAEYQGRKVKLNDPFRSNDGKRNSMFMLKMKKVM